MQNAFTASFLISGIVIEQEEIGSSDIATSHSKTTTITLTTATEAASKVNQHRNQGM